MARNKLMDLNNHLFEQLERLGDAMSDEELEVEIDRSKAVSSISKNIIDNARLSLEAEKFIDERVNGERSLPRMLTTDEE